MKDAEVYKSLKRRKKKERERAKTKNKKEQRLVREDMVI
jgi:hypothetical protein